MCIHRRRCAAQSAWKHKRNLFNTTAGASYGPFIQLWFPAISKVGAYFVLKTIQLCVYSVRKEWPSLKHSIADIFYRITAHIISKTNRELELVFRTGDGRSQYDSIGNVGSIQFKWIQL